MWPGFKSRRRRHMWVEFVVGSLLAPRGFSPGTPVFPSPQKPTLPNSNSIWNARRSLNEFIWVKKQFTIIFTSYCNTIFQSSNVFSILGGFFGGKTKSPCFDLFIHWLIKQIANTYQNHFSRSYENRSKLLEQVHVTCAKGGKVVKFLLMLIMIGRLSVGRPRNLLVRGMRCFWVPWTGSSSLKHYLWNFVTVANSPCELVNKTISLSTAILLLSKAICI